MTRLRQAACFAASRCWLYRAVWRLTMRIKNSLVSNCGSPFGMVGDGSLRSGFKETAPLEGTTVNSRQPNRFDNIQDLSLGIILLPAGKRAPRPGKVCD